jgi:hypothetical protein
MRKTQKRQSKKLIKNIGGGKDIGSRGSKSKSVSVRPGSKSVRPVYESKQIIEILKQKSLYPMPMATATPNDIDDYYNKFRAAFITYYEFNNDTNNNPYKTKLHNPSTGTTATTYYNKKRAIGVLKEFLKENFSKLNTEIHHQSDINMSRK